MTTLIACSHGTRFEEGRAEIAALVDEVRRALPGVRVVPAFVDVEEPDLAEVVAGLDPGEDAVVVPLLLSRGFHTRVDVARAVASRVGVVAAAPLGPHELLADVLASRLAEIADGDAGQRSGDHVVLAAAGSSDPAAADDVERLCDLLRPRLAAPITAGYAAGASPRIGEAVESARRAGARRVVVASYVLAPGYFANLVADAGGDVVSAPLGADPRIAQLIALRYRAALAG